MPFYYINNRICYISQPDDIDMMTDAEELEHECDLEDALDIQQEWEERRDELSDVLVEIGELPALMRKQAN